MLFIVKLVVCNNVAYAAVSQDKSQSGSQSTTNQRNTNDNNKDGAAYACLLKNELLGAGIEDVKDQQNDAANLQRSALLPKETRNLFQVAPDQIYYSSF